MEITLGHKYRWHATTINVQGVVVAYIGASKKNCMGGGASPKKAPIRRKSPLYREKAP